MKRYLLLACVVLFGVLRANAADSVAKKEDAPLRTVAELIGQMKAGQDLKVRERAARDLAGHGSKAFPAVPVLIDALGEKRGYLYLYSKNALIAIGSRSIPALQKAAAGRNEVRSRYARLALCTILPKERRTPLLKTWLRDRNEKIRYGAAFICRELGPEASDLVLPLSQALSDSAIQVRDYAARALGKMGAKAKPAVPQLIKALGDKRWPVRKSAARALGALRIDAVDALPALQKLLNDSNGQVRRYAKQSLADIKAAKDAIKGNEIKAAD